MCEKHNGWTNRETWACSLWLSNEEGTYNELHERLKDAREEYGIGYTNYEAGNVVREYWEEITDPDTFGDAEHFVKHILPMVTDVGSDYRIDWDEIGENWVSDLPPYEADDDDKDSE